MKDEGTPKITFPCTDYPIKIMGDAGAELYARVLAIMEKHTPDFEASKITVRDSRNGRFQSITVLITATGEPQLRTIYEELMISPIVKMVL